MQILEKSSLWSPKAQLGFTLREAIRVGFRFSSRKRIRIPRYDIFHFEIPFPYECLRALDARDLLA
jgi:hypothetical protein